MARVTVVKHARARFEMVDKVDPATGEPVRVPVMKKDGVTQKTTKSGALVFRTLSVQDRSKPLPNYTCGKCGVEIKPGMPYKWIEPKMRGLMVRCENCPNWNYWEYSDSLSARVAEIQSNAADALGVDFEDRSELEGILQEIASEIRSLAEEKEEAASNMEEGFGHSTYQSDELNEQAEQLNSWADEVESVDIPDMPEPEEQDCTECEATGEIDGETCNTCSGDKTLTPEEPTDEQMDEWRDEARQAAQDAVDNVSL